MDHPVLLLLLSVSVVCLFYGLKLRCLYLLKRIDNADARIARLEQVEDQRHGYDQAMDKKDVLRLRCKPDPICKKCKGRGHIGKNTKTNRFIPCVCCA